MLAARVALSLLAASVGLTGALAAFAPRSFYDAFPVGLSWVDHLPPYNQHLVTDAGGFYLAFALLFAWSAVTLSRALLVPLACAWAVEGTIHLVYHLLHLDGFSTADAIAQTAGFVLWLALPAIAVATARPRYPSPAAPT